VKCCTKLILILYKSVQQQNAIP